MISDLSAGFVRVGGKEIEQEIRGALKEIVLFFDYDRGEFGQFEEGAPVRSPVRTGALDFVPGAGADGKPAIYTGTGSIMMDMETDVWPIYGLRPARMLSAFYIRGSFELSYGKVLKDFG